MQIYGIFAAMVKERSHPVADLVSVDVDVWGIGSGRLTRCVDDIPWKSDARDDR